MILGEMVQVYGAVGGGDLAVGGACLVCSARLATVLRISGCAILTERDYNYHKVTHS